MSEWNRRDREEGQRRYGQEDRNRQDYGGEERWRDAPRHDNEQRSFDRAGRGDDRYRRASEGYGEGYRRSSGAPSYGGRPYGGGRAYDERDQDGLAVYGLGPFGSGEHPSGSRSSSRGYGGERGYGERGYGNRGYGDRQAYGQGGAVGHNERLERVSDGETDRHHFLGGGMMRGGEHRGRGPKNYTRSDDRIRDDINDRLSDDPWLDATEIDVAVNACEVTLSGTVNAREDRRRAEDLVEQVSGVKHVQNNLRVQAAGANSPTTAQGATGRPGSVTGASKPDAIQ